MAGSTQEQDVTSTERVMLFARDDATRVACRDATNRYFCDAEAAAASALACSAQASPTPTQLVAEKVAATCTKSGELYPTLASCATPLARHCGFYSACLERALPCGEEGYALGFGEHYCTAFRNAPMSPRGTAWAMGVMGCLQTALVPRVQQAGSFAATPESAAMCKAVFDEAFASHPACYTRVEDSLCFLPPGDIRDVLEVIGADELFTARTRAQIVKTIGICVGQIAERLVRATTGEAFPELDEQARLFDELARTYAPSAAEPR